jgi:deoxyribodipyrimidine photolyase-related protein
MILILLPNQLFEKKYLPIVNKIYLIEEPIYFGYRNKKMNFNKLKLVLHRASMKYYTDYNKDVEYIEIDNINYKTLLKGDVTMFHPYDYLLEKKYKKYNKNIKYIDNPNFILTEEQIQIYHNKVNGKNVRMTNFIDYVKEQMNILKGKKSYDKDNRVALPKNIKIPSLPKIKDDNYIKEAKKYINKKFKNNYGDVNNFIYPISHKESKKWLNNFIKKRFSNFGKYQDAIDSEEPFIFHSVISPMLNIGLLMPTDVIKTVQQAYKRSKNININDFEGFARQIMGWREYQRFCYKFYYQKMITTNIFKNKNKLNKNWYYGNTKIDPVDSAIKISFKYGYLHHIMRLMVMGNVMNLCGIHPDEIYKWFMEFSCDSYDWVMIQNVYSMATWSDKGLTMSKPYFSTDNYIMTMGNFKKGRWNDIWSALFYNFLDKHKKIIKNTPYIRNYIYFKKLSMKEKRNILDIANNFIKNNIK